MARYCEKCGKALADNTEFCADCYGQQPHETDAALFTRITAETEVWREPVPTASRVSKIKSKVAKMKKQLAIGAGGLVALCLVAVLVVSFLPSSRINRALKSGEYDRAFELYTQTLASSGSANSRVGQGLVSSAQDICERFASGDLSFDEAKTFFDILYSFDIYTEGLDEKYGFLNRLLFSAESMSLGKQYEADGSFIEAYECFLNVIEESPEYELAQEKMAQCLVAYSNQILSQAGKIILEDDYLEAIKVLKEGYETLRGYDSFSEEIDAKLLEYSGMYETVLLTEAKFLADEEKYQVAVEFLLENMEHSGIETENLDIALNRYKALSDEKIVLTSAESAQALYETDEKAAAFDLLEQTKENLFDESAIAQTIERFEKQFVEDAVAAAKVIMASDTKNVSAAYESAQSAYEIRPHDELKKYLAYLASSAPENLSTMLTSEKSDTVFRSTGSFSAVDDFTSTDGWIWGRNGEHVIYSLEGKFDTFEGTFAVRRDDNSYISGYFEVWCDGELRFTSETLKYQSDSVRFTVDISGCSELKLVFYCNYETSTAHSGYCHHGICDPIISKNFEDFVLWAQ